MTFSIFLSHHETETSPANTFRNHVEEVGGGTIKVHTFVQKTEPDFRDWIRRKVLDADMLVFFYSDTSRRLDWHGFEVGMYWAARETHGRTVMVQTFMTPGIEEMPKVFNHLVGTPGTAKNFEAFLRHLLLNGTYSEKKVLARDRPGDSNTKLIRKAAIDIANQFSSRLIAEYFTDRICIGPIKHHRLKDFKRKLDAHRHLVREGLHNDRPETFVLDFSPARITGSESILRSLGLPGEGQAKWSNLLQRERNTRAPGCFTLASEILDYSRDDLVNGQDTKVLSLVSVGGSVYQPLLSRIEKRDQLPVSYFVIFVGNSLSRSADVQKDEMLRESHDLHSKVVLLLNMARRFRWNVIETYISRIRQAQHMGEDLIPVLKELDDALVVLEREAEHSGVDDVGLAAVRFPKQHRERIRTLWLDYFNNRQCLNRHIAAGDVMSVLEVLCTFQKFNSEFMTIALGTYSDFMHSLPTLDDVAPKWRDDFLDARPIVRPLVHADLDQNQPGPRTRRGRKSSNPTRATARRAPRTSTRTPPN